VRGVDLGLIGTHTNAPIGKAFRTTLRPSADCPIIVCCGIDDGRYGAPAVNRGYVPCGEFRW
jgi:hypothetical protein